MFDAQQFSKDLKIQKNNYQYGAPIAEATINTHLTALKTFSLDCLKTERSKKTFWINVYNGLTNYLIIYFNIQKTMKEIEGVFSKKIVTIDDTLFSLNDIEHGILRRNARQKWTADHPMLPLMMEKLDYRIHFALNCGANSCPAIAFYHPETIEEELAMAEQLFVRQEFEVNTASKHITCSALFQWYEEDFGQRFINDPRYEDYEISYKEYDWRI